MTSRRRFLGDVSACALLTLIGRDLGAAQPARPTRLRRATLNVRDFGARGDGLADDTDAFAAAVHALPMAGGVVDVPDGTYRIDPIRSIVLRDDVTLQLAPTATLAALPVESPHSAVIVATNARNVHVRGGRIVGERSGHTGRGGEWGMGILLRGCQSAVVDQVTITDCWGDGIYVGAGHSGESRDVTIRDCRVRNNRRQGLSLTGCIGATVVGCEFSGTGGTNPQSGIDVEPNGHSVARQITIRDCVVAANHGFGIVLSGANVTEVTVEGCRCTGNLYIAGIELSHVSRCIIRNNTIADSGGCAIQLVGARQNTIADNVIGVNGAARPMVWDGIALQHGSSDNVVSGNDFTAASRAPDAGTRFDISVTADSVDNQLLDNRVGARRYGAYRRELGGIWDAALNTTVRGSQPWRRGRPGGAL